MGSITSCGRSSVAPRATCGRILLIEDDFGTRAAVANVLLDQGYEVDCAANGLEGLHRLEVDASPPALIILDLWMPYMDGLEFRAIQKSLSGHDRVPVLVTTAVRPKATPGLDDVRILMKPLGLEAILAAVSELTDPEATRPASETSREPAHDD